MNTNDRIKQYQNAAEAIARAALDLQELGDPAAAELLAYAYDFHAQARVTWQDPGREPVNEGYISMRDRHVDVLLDEAHHIINDEAA